MSKSRPWWAFWRKKAVKKIDDDLRETRDLVGVSWEDGAEEGGAKKASWWPFGKKGSGVEVAKQETRQLEAIKEGSTRPALEAIKEGSTRPVLKAVSAPVGSEKEEVVESEEKLEIQLVGEEEADPHGSDVLFGVLFLLSTVAFSLPIWMTSLPPMRDLGARLGLLSLLQQPGGGGLLDGIMHFRPELYAGSAVYYVLYVLVQGLSPERAAQVLLQCYVLLTPLALLFFLRSCGRPRWNVFLGFFFLYNIAFVEGQLEFLLSTPLFLFGLGCLYRWIVRSRAVAGLGLIVVTWGLLLIDLRAYAVFFGVLVVVSAFLSGSFAEWFGNVMLACLSWLLLLPWLYFLFLGGHPVAGFVEGAAWFSYAGYVERALGLVEILPRPVLHGVGRWWLVGLLVLVVLGWAGRFIFRSEEGAARRLGVRFFPASVGLFFLVIYFLFPAAILGKSLSLGLLLALVGWCLVGTVQLQPGTVWGYLVICLTVLGGFAGSTILCERLLTQAKESEGLRSLILRVPAKRKLLVWQLGHAQSARFEMNQSGGYYMFWRGGMSNVRFQGLGWPMIELKPRVVLPDPWSAGLPSFRGWEYFLTGLPLSRSQRRGLSLLGRSGSFRLYRILGGGHAPVSRRRVSALRGIFVQGCRAGKGESCRRLGILYADGQGVSRDPLMAQMQYRRACGLRDGMGCRLLGELLLGQGASRRDWGQIHSSFRRACELKDKDGCYSWGLLYKDGKGARRSCKKAKGLFLRACRMGLERACDVECR